MLKITASARLWVGLVLMMAGFGVSGAVLGGPIGYLQIEGQIDVKSPGDERPVRVSDNNFTVFSGDRIHTRRGSAVLVLTGGGALGLVPGSEAGIYLDESSREIELELFDGTLLYSLPAAIGGFAVVMDDFRLQSASGGERPVQVSLDEDNGIAGQIERLENGHIRVAVRSGQMQVTSGSGGRYLVAAGDQVGLMAGSPGIERVSSGNPEVGEFKIESPEQVKTRENFSIRWEIPEIPEDGFVTIAKPDADPEEFESLASITQGQIIEFEAPGMPGDYEIRFIDAETGQITNFVYLKVVGDPIAIPWFRTGRGIAGLGIVISGGSYIICCTDDDDDPDPVSP